MPINQIISNLTFVPFSKKLQTSAASSYSVEFLSNFGILILSSDQKVFQNYKYLLIYALSIQQPLVARTHEKIIFEGLK